MKLICLSFRVRSIGVRIAVEGWIMKTHCHIYISKVEFRGQGIVIS